MLETILHFVASHLGLTIIGAITLIQIVPIKLDPWTALGKAIRHLLVGDIEKKLDAISKKVDTLESQFSEEKAIRARARILRFSDEVYNGVYHSKDHFEDILDDIKMYNEYCDKHPAFLNNKTEISAAIIKDTYKKLVDEHKF